jgi:signal transduction histidine kinase
VIGEDGKVVLSSIPSRTDQDAPVRPTLISLRNSDFFDRVSEIANSRTDYESRTPLGIADQVKPVFEIQVLVSPILLRDRIKPSVITTAWVLLFALLAAVIMAGVSSHLALLPVRRIGKAIDTLATGRPLGLPDPRQSGEDREIAAVEYKLSLLGEQMQGAKRDADQMRSAIGKLVRSVAHEIKNPLNAISLRLETLRMRVVDEVPDAEPEIDILSSEVQRLDGVVRTFLDLNRPMELNIGEFDPVELAAHVMEMMRPAAKQANVLLELVQPHLPLVVSADRGLIEQGLVNIVNNAIQALGSVTGRDGTGGMVRTSVAMVNGNCEIAVTDNGPGMPESVRDKIFEPYFTTKESGSGIGLAVTKRAMDLHRGRITVETAPGKGTRMILSFPMVHA